MRRSPGSSARSTTWTRCRRASSEAQRLPELRHGRFPNFARFICDGDGSTFEAPEGYVAPESAAIETLFETFYDSRGLAYEDTEFDGRSDYEAFANAGIPSGGLFTGAEEEKTAAQAARYGGEAGVAFDPCYHAACDGIGNVDFDVLDQNADAIAYATLPLAQQGHRGGGS